MLVPAAFAQRGLPRPRDHTGAPIPYITRLHHDGTPDWRRIDPQLALECQAAWLCQVCGLELPPRAWVVVEPGGQIVSGTAVHRDCLTVATSRCPHLRSDIELDTREVDRSQVVADGGCLADFPIPEHYDDFGPYGDRLRTWRLHSESALDRLLAETLESYALDHPVDGDCLRIARA